MQEQAAPYVQVYNDVCENVSSFSHAENRVQLPVPASQLHLEGWAGRLFLLFPRSRGVLKQPLPVGSQAVKFPVPIALVLGPVRSGSLPACSYTLCIPSNPTPGTIGDHRGGCPARAQVIQCQAPNQKHDGEIDPSRPPPTATCARVACFADE